MNIEEIDAFRKEFMGEWYRPVTEGKLRWLLDQPNVKLVTITDQGRLVGMAFTYLVETLTRRVVIFDEFIIAEDFRGKGYGNELLHRIVEHAMAMSADCVECTVREDNAVALDLYTKYGFKDRGNRALRRWLKNG
jgi:ribosomal protein S18 acetylase RimI-like enzyme